MSENYLIIEDFRGGEDTRRFVLSSQAGTLRLCRNAHITPGGEIEKRGKFSFIQDSILSDPVIGLKQTFRPGTFGLQKTSAGLAVFGSKPYSGRVQSVARAANVATLVITFLNTDEDPDVYGWAVGDWLAIAGCTDSSFNADPDGGTPSKAVLLSVTLGVNSATITYSNTGPNVGTAVDGVGIATLIFPDGFDYVRCEHPAVLAGTTYDNTKHAMTAIIHSECFSGLSFAVATFADGYSFCYYDGELVGDFVNGRILPYLNTNAKIATHFGTIVTADGQYTLDSVVSNVATVSGPYGSDFSVETEYETAAGTISVNKTQEPTSPVEAVAGTASFRVIAGGPNAFASGTLTGSASNVSDGDTVTIGTKTYTFKTTLGSTEGQVHIGGNTDASLLNLIRAINHTGTPNTDYVAAAQNADVSSAQTVGAGHTVVVTARNPGTSGNAITTTEVAATLSWGSATLTGGLDTNKITALTVNGITVFDTATPILWANSNAETAKTIADRINAYTSSLYTAESTGDKVILTSELAGAQDNGQAVSVTAAGNFCVGNLAITFVGTGFTLSAVNIDGTDIKGAMSGGLSLSNYSNSIQSFVTALSASINAGSAVYTSFPKGNTIYISKLITTSSDAELTADVVFSSVNAGAGAALSNVPDNEDLPFTVVAAPDGIVKTQATSTFASGIVTATPANGVAPYTPYLWQEASTGSGSGIVISSPSTASTQFTKTITTKQTVTGRFVCKVRDAGGNYAYSNVVTVTFVRT